MFLDKTVIIQAPASQTVRASSTVTFECSAETDPETVPLVVEWLRNGVLINLQYIQHISMRVDSNTLEIIDSKVVDSANYSCRAKTPLDSVQAHATLIVQGKSPNSDMQIFHSSR